MKLIKLIPLILLLSCSHSTTKPKNDLEELGLKGRVKEIIYHSYDPVRVGDRIENGNEKELGMGSDRVKRFNEDGNLQFNVWSSGSQAYKYNEKNQLETVEFTIENGKTNIIHKLAYKDDLLEKTDIFENNINTSTIYCKYDEHGNLIEEKSSGLSGMSNFRTIYEYKNGNLVRKVSIDNKGDTFSTMQYNYKGGKLVEDIFLTPDSTSCLIHTYDDQGFTKTSQDLSKPVTNPNSLLYGLSRDVDRSLITYSYDISYDSKGNWIRLVKFKNGDPVSVSTRDISYFKDLGSK